MKRLTAHIDWFVFLSALCISLAGLVTMRSFSVENTFFDKQVVWIIVGCVVFFCASIPEYRFLRRTPIVMTLFGAIALLLVAVFAVGVVSKGAQSWFRFGFLGLQPAELAKLVLIITLAKYFARRHVEIADFKHILVSGGYALILCLLIFLQPDFGSAMIVASIWFGMVLIAGLSWRHLFALLFLGAMVGGGLWTFVFKEYQKQRIINFLHPLADIRGTGYNAYQSTVAVGSGGVWGKGIGYGTQSKLQFLPEYQTDFIFAAFAEEWGFIGVLFLFGLYGILITRVVIISSKGADTFVMLFGAGVAVLFITHFTVHIGMNIGLLPVTGVTVPFMSYGGSHLLVEYLMLGILMGLRRDTRPVALLRERVEFVGPV
ncbi:rod shape-determining protein RodA [bacterium]|nr:rod shape-determining protein RodA [bacterium]